MGRKVAMNNIPKGYKQTEVGVIPEDWGVKKLGDCLKQNPEYGINAPAVAYSDSLPAYIRITDISEDGKYLQENKASISHFFANNYYLEVGDLVFARTGASVGKTYLYDPSDGKFVFAGFLIRVKVNPEKLDPKYLESFTRTHGYWNWVRVMSMRSGQPGINGNEYKQLPIPLPPTKTEQTTIATALSDADALINSLEKLIAKKRNIKQGAMQQLLKPKDGWVVKKLGEIFTFHGGYTASRDQLSDDGYCYLHYGDIHGANKTFINVTSDYSTIPKLQIPLKKVPPKSLLNDGDIVFVDASEDDEGTSRHIVVKNPHGVPYISGLHTIVAKSKDNIVNDDYKRYCFQITYIKSQFKFYAVGTKVSGISKTNIAKIEISLPSPDEQTAIAQVLSDMDAEIEAMEHKLAKHRMIKQGMMQELLTGKTRFV